MPACLLALFCSKLIPKTSKQGPRAANASLGPLVLPGERKAGAAEAAAATGARVDHHRCVLQGPQHGLLPTKSFHHDHHQQVEVHRVKSGEEAGRNFTTKDKGCGEKWGLLRAEE